MVIDLSNKNIFKVLSTESRRADLTPSKLANIHTKLGELISYEILDFFELKNKEIQHVQGIKKSLSLDSEEKFLIITLMRGGLYAAEGVKKIFDGQFNMEFVSNNDIDFIHNYKASNYNLIIVDSVINTGKSIDNILKQFSSFNFKNIFIVSLVLQEKAFEKYNTNENITLLTARISKNFYIGKGSTDTGNRLFKAETTI